MFFLFLSLCFYLKKQNKSFFNAIFNYSIHPDVQCAPDTSASDQNAKFAAFWDCCKEEPKKKGECVDQIFSCLDIYYFNFQNLDNNNEDHYTCKVGCEVSDGFPYCHQGQFNSQTSICTGKSGEDYWKCCKTYFNEPICYYSEKYCALSHDTGKKPTQAVSFNCNDGCSQDTTRAWCSERAIPAWFWVVMGILFVGLCVIFFSQCIAKTVCKCCPESKIAADPLEARSRKKKTIYRYSYYSDYYSDDVKEKDKNETQGVHEEDVGQEEATKPQKKTQEKVTKSVAVAAKNQKQNNVETSSHDESSPGPSRKDRDASSSHSFGVMILDDD